MHAVPHVVVTLRPSRLMALGLVAGALLLAGTAVMLPLGWGEVVLAWSAIAAWVARAISRDALKRSRNAIVRLRVDGNLSIVATRRDGVALAGRVVPSSYVGSAVTTVAWRAPRAWRGQAVLILPDGVDGDACRRLRVLLRYARSGAAAGDPASQA